MVSVRRYSSSASDDALVAPPAKKPRLRLNVRKPSESSGDTIAVSSRPKRKSTEGKTYTQTGVFVNEPEPVRELESPAPSSGLSSLESAPPSEDGDKEESPFRDPTPTSAVDEYGDFSSYYILQGDEEPAAAAPAPKPTAKPKGKTKKGESPKQKKPKVPKEPKASKESKRAKAGKEVNAAKATNAAPAKPAPNLPQQTAPPPPIAGRPPPPQPNGPPPLPQQHHQAIPVQHQARPQNLPPNYSNQPPRPLQNGPPPPIIQYMEIQTDPKPTRPDTIDIMIRKLEALSAALTNFGGVPAIPPTPPARPVDQPKPQPQPQPQSKPKPKPVEVEGGDVVGDFLKHFGDDEDDDDDSESEDQSSANVLRNPGMPDGPLTYGIQFIQNALKSWAQQRTSQQVTTQWQAQQAQLQSQIKRGPGRPKRYDDTISHVQPVIHMDLGNTPEGIAIKAFQAVLDSGCLQVNCVLSIELSRALRHLYMQIDHLINQGQKVDGPWQCMSYGAQIAAHKSRVAKFKDTQQKAQEEALQQQKLRELGIAHTVPLGAAVPLSAFQAQQQHEMELERRRSEQHAAQQPYNSHNHLYPMQVAAQAPGGPAPPNSAGRESAPPGVPVGSPTTAGQHQLNSQSVMQGPSSLNQGSTAGHELDRIRLYMPGYLPRSGQSMKFSFAPHNDTVAQAWGSDAFPAEQQGPNIPNRGPMSAPPSQPALADNRSSNAANVPGGDAGSPIDLDADTPMQDAPTAQVTATNGQPSASTTSTPAPPATTGFTPVNAPPAPPAEQPAATSPGTIKVATRPSSTTSASRSPTMGFNAVNRPNGAAMTSNFPHPGAIVVDQ